MLNRALQGEKWVRTHIGHYQRGVRFSIWDYAIPFNVELTARSKTIVVIWIRKTLDGRKACRQRI